MATDVANDPQNDAFGGSTRKGSGVFPQSPALKTIRKPAASARYASQVIFVRVDAAPLGRAANDVISPTAASNPTIERFRMTSFMGRLASVGKLGIATP